LQPNRVATGTVQCDDYDVILQIMSRRPHVSR
jgi:hypothetical protein